MTTTADLNVIKKLMQKSNITVGQNYELKSLKELMVNNSAHLGHTTMHSSMFPYIIGTRAGFSIFNLELTLVKLRKIAKLIKFLIKNDGKILIINNDSRFSSIVKKVAENWKQYYINEKWVGGFLTNFDQVKKSITLYKNFDKSYGNFVKENNIYFPKYNKIKQRFQGVSNMKTIPDLIFLVQANDNDLIINEAKRCNIPIISFVDSNINLNPDTITYSIPVNDDNITFIYNTFNYITKLINKKNIV